MIDDRLIVLLGVSRTP